MTIIEMLQQSLLLVFLGMAVVFLFFCIMIACVNFIGKLIHARGLDKDVSQPVIKGPGKTDKTVRPEVVAAITAAVTEHIKLE